MKKITLLLLFSVFINAQDVLTTVSGQKYKGEFVEQKERNVLFMPENGSLAQTIPIQLIRYIRLGSGEILHFSNDILTTKSGDVYKGKYIHTTQTDVLYLKDGDTQARSFQKEIIDNIKLTNGSFVDLEKITKVYSKEDLAELEYRKRLQESCDKNKEVRVLIIPIRDDFYGISQIIEENYDSLCFNIVSNIEALEYLHKEQVSINEINDYHLIKAGQAVSANFVIYGYAYKINVPFKYSPTTSDPLAVTTLFENQYNDTWGNLFNALGRSIVIKGQQAERGQAIIEAGIYIKMTYFSINVETEEKKYLLQNETVIKLG